MFNHKIKSSAARASYDDFVGSGGTPNDRRVRAESWFKENPTLWTEVPPPPPAMTTAERNAFRYRVEQPQPPPVVLADSRPAHEGYDTFNFATNHPATRR